MDLSQKFIKKLMDEKDKVSVPRSSTLAVTTSEKILSTIKTKYGYESDEEALAVVAIFAQQGATAKNCDGNMTIQFLGKTIKLAEIRKIFNTNGAKSGMRKFCRSFDESIYNIALILNLPGNLYLKISKMNPDRKFTDKEKVALSDFQSNNEEISQDFRKLIMESFNNKAQKKQQK